MGTLVCMLIYSQNLYMVFLGGSGGGRAEVKDIFSSCLASFIVFKSKMDQIELSDKK